MRLYIHIIFPFFVMTLAYTLLSFFFGATGIYAQKKLEEELKNVMKNINMINQKGEELDIMIKNLTSDEQTIKIFAHDLGYISENEKIIKLSPFKHEGLSQVSYGSAVTIQKSAFISDRLCKQFAILMGIISLIVEILIVKSYDYQERRSQVYIYN